MKKKVGELTKNERALLSLLGIIIIVWFAYRSIIIPQKDKLIALNKQKLEYRKKINEINSTLKNESSLNQEWETLHREKEQILSKYFPRLDQAQIIYLLNDLIDHEDVSIIDLSFSRPTYEELEGLQIKSMDISLPYNGTYEGIIDIVNSIKRSERKILVDSLSMDRNKGELLSGTISLKIYSLEGIADRDDDIIYIDTTVGGNKPTPFSEYDDYSIEQELEVEILHDESLLVDENLMDIRNNTDKTKVNPYIEEILLDFESNNNYFLASQPFVKGKIMQSTNSKSKQYSLRFEYDILAIGKENRAYLDISRNQIILKYPPNSMGMWIYSYDYSPITVGIGFNGQMGGEEFVPLTEGIGWKGWKYLELNPPTNLNIYPLKVDKIYIEMPQDREEFGVILMDKLEAIYTRNLDDGGSNKGTTDYMFHVVDTGDTIEKISMKYYGTIDYGNEILRLNEMKSGDILDCGRVLVLKKP